MGAVSKALKHGEQTCCHEMLGLCQRGQRLRSCGHSLSGWEDASLSHHWVFCSQRCQRCFHKLYEVGVRLLNRGDAPISVKEGEVIDPSEAEMAAMHRCLKPLGEAANEVGMDRALSTYSQDEALLLINAVVTTYVESMVQAHEAGKYPPLRMLGQESYG